MTRWSRGAEIEAARAVRGLRPAIAAFAVLALIAAAAGVASPPANADGAGNTPSVRPPLVPPQKPPPVKPASPPAAKPVPPPPALKPLPPPIAPMNQPAAAPPPPPAPPVQAAAAQLPGARTGEISLANGAVQLTVPANFSFYTAAEAQGLLARHGKPAPQGDVLGLLAPAGKAPSAEDFWGAVVSWHQIGRVPATGAERLTQPTFIGAVRGARSFPGPAPDAFESPPVYDAVGNTLTWSERYTARNSLDRSIRHEQRLLGRDGVVGLTVVALPGQLDAVRSDTRQMLGMVTFPRGRGYTDFDPKKDAVSTFDLPGLITQQARSGGPVAETAGGSVAQPAAPQANAEGGMMARLPSWFPWLAGGLVGLPLLLWAAFGSDGGRRKPKASKSGGGTTFVTMPGSRPASPQAADGLTPKPPQ